MRKFSVPYNSDIELIDRLFAGVPDTAAQCCQIFAPIPNNLTGTCRVVSQGEDYEGETEKLIRIAHQKGIETDLLINPGCLGMRMVDVDSFKPIIEYLKRLLDLVPLDSVTLADFLLAKEIKKTFPKLGLECSCMANIDNMTKAKYWVDLGCGVIVIHPDKNKDMGFIRQLRRNFPEVKLKMILNEVCVPDCPMRQGHSNLESHGDWGGLYHKACFSIFKKEPWLFYSSPYIAPKYLDYYDDLIDIFKILDRDSPTEEIIETFGTYAGDEKYLSLRADWDTRLPQEVYDRVLQCDRRCDQCGLCKKVYTDPATPPNSYMTFWLANHPYNTEA